MLREILPSLLNCKKKAFYHNPGVFKLADINDVFNLLCDNIFKFIDPHNNNDLPTK